METPLEAHDNQISPDMVARNEVLQTALIARERVRDRHHAVNPRVRSTTPWYLSHCLFLAILMIRLLRRSTNSIVPWWLIFTPLLLSSATVLIVKSSESYLMLKNSSTVSQVLSYKTHCSLLDHTGYTFTVVLICVFLSTTVIPSIGVVAVPVLVTSLLSLVYRSINLPPTSSRTIGRLFISSLFNCLMHTLVRIVQPILLVIKLDDYAPIRWVHVAIPLWSMCVGAVLAALVLVYISTFLHARSSTALRIHASKLMLLCAFQLLVLSVCSFLSGYW